MVLEQVVQVSVAVSEGPDDGDGGESQVVGGGFGEDPGDDQSAQDLEDGADDRPLALADQDQHDVHELKSLDESQHGDVHLDVRGHEGLGVPEEGDADVEDQEQPS